MGAVITTIDNYVLGIGYNGVPRGFSHCLESACPGATAQSGTALEECLAVHAEMNALLQCTNPEKAAKLYVTVSPCISCAKVIANTTIKSIITAEVYPQSGARDILDVAGISLTVRSYDAALIKSLIPQGLGKQKS